MNLTLGLPERNQPRFLTFIIIFTLPYKQTPCNLVSEYSRGSHLNFLCLAYVQLMWLITVGYINRSPLPDIVCCCTLKKNTNSVVVVCGRSWSSFVLPWSSSSLNHHPSLLSRRPSAGRFRCSSLGLALRAKPDDYPSVFILFLGMIYILTYIFSILQFYGRLPV